MNAEKAARARQWARDSYRLLALREREKAAQCEAQGLSHGAKRHAALAEQLERRAERDHQ